MDYKVLRGKKQVVCVVDYKGGKEKKEVKEVEQLHNIFMLDRSGSMTWDIDNAVDNMQEALKSIASNDYVSVIWFSGAGECKTLIKGSKNDENLSKLMDSLRSTVGLTCFSEALEEAQSIVEDLRGLCSNFAVTLFTDGRPVVPWGDEESRIAGVLKELSGEILALNTIGYGNYYNEELLKSMSASTVYGKFVHTKELKDLRELITHNYERVSGIRLEKLEATTEGSNLVYVSDRGVQVYKDSMSLQGIAKKNNKLVFYGEEDFKFTVNGEEYTTEGCEVEELGAEDEGVMYALAYGLAYRGEVDSSLRVLAEFLGDKELIDKQVNAFTPDERGEYLKAVESAVEDKGRRNVGTCDSSYIPADDALCVMDVLGWLTEQDGVKYIYKSDYNRIGLAIKEEANYFERVAGETLTDFKELSYNKEKVNVSIRSKIKGEVKLNPKQADRVGLSTTIESHIYRTQTVIKDGYLNMEELLFAVPREVYNALKEKAEEEGKLKVKELGSIEVGVHKLVKVEVDFKGLPVINKKYAGEGRDLDVVHARTVESVKLEARQKMCNYVLKQTKEANGIKTGEFAKLTDEQVELLKDYGLDSKLSYVGVGTKRAEKGEDYYEARKIKYVVKGSTSAPSGADVIKKMEAGKAQNYLGKVMEEWYKEYKAEVGEGAGAEKVVEYCENYLREVKKKLQKIRLDVCRMNMGIVLTNYWFTGAELDGKGNVTYTKDGVTVLVQCGKEKVYY